MKWNKLVMFLAVAISVSLPQSATFAQSQPAASQTAGGVSQQEKMIEKGKSLQTKIEQQKTSGAEAASQDVGLADTGAKVLVKRIDVEGATLISSVDLQAITSRYEGQELSLRGMQKVASLISDAYRKKGYFTSRAYIPPQKVQEGVLLVKVVEGKLGMVDVKGNRYFSTPLLKKNLSMQSGGYFDYSALQRALVYINEHPDRSVKAVLVPGTEPGVTNVVMDVKDRLPIHAGFEFDNYGSRYIDKRRYAGTLEHNNLTGHDDKMYLKYQTSEASYMRLIQGRYVFPLTPTLDIGAYALANKLKLGRDFEDLESRGKARIYGFFVNKSVIRNPDLDLRLNGGFDYKSIVNFLSGSKNSRDELRIFKIGLDLDASDSLGRSIISPEFDFGVPDLFGGMEAKDPLASRAGSGAVFQKGIVNFYRLQPAPLATSLLWKNSAQFSNHTLAASEQFQIGGPVSVRGYPPAENSGDKGYYTSLEWSLPLYMLPKDIKVPGKQERLYDAVRMVAFWDWGFVNSRNVSPTEKENTTLRGVGVGARFNVKDLSARVELGYPIGREPSDNMRPHPWVEFTCKY